jgi:hypothetical protein
MRSKTCRSLTRVVSCKAAHDVRHFMTGLAGYHTVSERCVVRPCDETLPSSGRSRDAGPRLENGLTPVVLSFSAPVRESADSICKQASLPDPIDDRRLVFFGILTELHP